MARLPKSVVAQCCGLLCVLLARGAQADSSKAAVVETGLEGDSVALIQQKMEPRFRRSSAGSSLVHESSALKGEHAEAQLPVNLPFIPFMDPKDCAAHPAYCEAPFECQNTNSFVQAVWGTLGFAPDGKPNWRSWCNSPEYEPYASKCAAGDLVGAGLVQYQLTTAGAFGPDIAELDASYCFMDGLCADTTVSNSTTVEEMVEMCDKRFGRETWATFGADFAPPDTWPGYKEEELHEDFSNGFSSREQTRPYLLAACAMGNFHCDFMYCKNYCQNDYYKNKYGHLLKDYGWIE